ncbi:MAG: TraB/GumN family protein [Saprospiraceae bacterium]|nr:TraB/GumN family protein [Saprospiraceae bacterium]
MKKNKNSLVWRIHTVPNDSTEGERITKPSYILGTMHVKDARAFQFERLFYEKILSCDTFATELNLDEVQQSHNFSFHLPEGILLTDLIKPKLYAKISQIIEQKIGAPLAYFNTMKPIVLTNMLTESTLSNDRLLSLDETLWRFAADNGRILRGIETLDEQIDVLNKMSLTDQVKGLKDMVYNLPKFKRQLLKMTDLYEQADIQQLYKSAKRTAKSSRRLLVYDRNVLMANRIAEICQTTSLCAAIGAGHLAGEKGVLRLLKKKGFIVEYVE